MLFCADVSVVVASDRGDAGGAAHSGGSCPELTQTAHKVWPERVHRQTDGPPRNRILLRNRPLRGEETRLRQRRRYVMMQ